MDNLLILYIILIIGSSIGIIWQLRTRKKTK
jgi:hypothetical protein